MRTIHPTADSSSLGGKYFHSGLKCVETGSRDGIQPELADTSRRCEIVIVAVHHYPLCL